MLLVQAHLLSVLFSLFDLDAFCIFVEALLIAFFHFNSN